MPAGAITEFPVPESSWHVDPGFLNSLNYEIRTPLSGIMGMADLLLDTGLTDAQREYVDAARFCAQTLNDVLNTAVEYANVSSARPEAEETHFEPAVLIESAVEEHRLRARLRRLELDCNVESAVPTTLKGNGRRLREAVCHLLSHAIRSAPGRRLTVNVSATPVRASACALRVLMFDSGWENTPERLCERRESARSRAEEGAPLSIALADRIARSIGGDVVVDTAPDGSSRSMVKAEFGVPSEEEKAVTRDNSDKPRILLVEDNDVFQTVVRHMLRRHDLQVDCVSDGAAAIERARSVQYDLLLMDLQMPVMDGFATTEQIRRIPGYEKTPVLAITANTSDEFRSLSGRHILQEFLPKPIRSSDLIAAIRRWVP